MANKKKYYNLDEVGFVGTTKKRSAAEIKSDIKQTSDIIKNYQEDSVKVNIGPASKKKSFSAEKTKLASSTVKRAIKIK